MQQPTRKCVNCCVPEEDEKGYLTLLDENGLCEECAEQKELCRALDEDERKEKDFDYSMNG